MSALHVACASGPDYAPHAAAMLRSVIEHRGGLEVRGHYLVSPRFPRDVAARIARMVESAGATIEFHPIPDEWIAGLPSHEIFSPAVWYRLFLPGLLDVDRVLYLDADTIAVDDLSPLWSSPLADHYAAAVPNVWEPWNAHRPSELGLAGPRDYLNSGVLLLNLARLRDDDMTAALLSYGRERAADLRWLDQDALSAVLAGRWLRLHPRWNCMNSILLFDWAADVLGAEAVDEARRSPGIRHFEGRSVNKPWHLLCDRDMRDAYLRHRRGTPWPRVRREGVTPANVMRRALRWRP